jgi:ABC-type nickel/cobalt efflux system permease component RcnA
MTAAARRLIARLAGTAGLAAVIGVLLPPAAASAHPLGNFSVNQLGALTLRPDRVDVEATIDAAELPTLQDQPAVDRAGTEAYARATCAELASAFRVTVNGRRLQWTVSDPLFEYAEGAAGLRTSRLDCALTAPADLSGPSTVEVSNGFRSDRAGWHELTAVSSGVHLIGSPLPTSSVSNGLRSYPDDTLASPPDVRSAALRVAPGGASGASGGASGASSGASGASGVPGWLKRAETTLTGWIGGELTPVVGALAILLALVLGAAHAALPGHGKTVMAAYLAGRHGRPRDALAVGATVTLTHTGGVLALGLLLTSAAGLAGETVLGWLGVASGILVAAIGIGMLYGVLRGRRHTHHDHDHGHGHGHHHGEQRVGRLGVVGMGVAGGLVPSPSALVILLGAIALGRTAFGLLLVVAYGLGMAATLTAAGLLLIRVRDRWAGRFPAVRRLSAIAPTGTAALVLLVGLGLAGRALATL